MTERQRLTAVIPTNALSERFRRELRDLDSTDGATLSATVSRWYRIPSSMLEVTHTRSGGADEGVLTVKFDPPSQSDIEAAARAYATGISLAECGDLHAARGAFDHAIELNPFDANPRSAAGQCCLEDGDLETTEDYLLGALVWDPKNAVALQLLGNVYFSRGDARLAIQLYERSMESEPTPYAAANLGAAFGKLGELEEARRHFERALALDPTYDRALYGISLIDAKKR